MYNSIVKLAGDIVSELKTTCVSDIKDLRYIVSESYIKDKTLSIEITQEEYDAYVTSKNI